MATTHIGTGVPLSSRAATWAEGSTTYRPSSYRGDDRRGMIVEEQRWPGPGFLVALGLALTAGVLAFTLDATGPSGLDGSLVGAQLDAAAFALALPLAALCFVRWRLVTESAVAWLGTALALYGLLTIGLGRAVAWIAPLGDGPLSTLPSAALIVAFCAIVGALLAPEVDANLRPWRLAAGAGTVTILVAVVLAQVPSLRPSSVVVVAGWSLLGVASLVLGLSRRRHLLAWYGLAFCVLAVASASATAGGSASLAPSLLRLLALGLAIAGVARGLARAFVQQGGRLFASMTAALVAEAQAEAQRTNQHERAHEARNALAAIQAATLALGYHARSTDPAAEPLTFGVASEIRRLARLVEPDAQQSDDPTPFAVRDVLVGVASCARAQGTTVALEVSPGLQAHGRAAETTQVLHNLLQNARRYGGDRVEVRAAQEGDTVVIRVTDDGPGITAAERARIFERGFRGRAASGPGDGLGLFIGTQLMAGQDGELRLEDRNGRGACFAVVLPAAEPLSQEAVDEAEQRREVPVTA